MGLLSAQEGKLLGWGAERLQGLMAFLAGEARDVLILDMVCPSVSTVLGCLVLLSLFAR